MSNLVLHFEFLKTHKNYPYRNQNVKDFTGVLIFQFFWIYITVKETAENRIKYSTNWIKFNKIIRLFFLHAKEYFTPKQ